MYNIGDKVIYNKENKKYIYIIKEIKDNRYTLYGINNRQVIICSEENIELIDHIYIKNILEKEDINIRKIFSNLKNRKTNKYLFGRILHIDGDNDLLNKCLDLYKDIGINAQGYCIEENKIHKYIEELITKLTPDIVVLTGHDQYNGSNIKDLSSYKNTSNFIKAIRIIRKYYSDTVIIAGACGSNFEALIGNGANIASSPKRLNTHTYDPAVAAIKVATTPYDQKVDFRYIYKYIENGKDAIGGIETNGKMKLLQ